MRHWFILRAMMFATFGILLGVAAQADPIDEAYWRSFYILPIGAWGAETPVPATSGPPAVAAYPNGIGSVQEWKTQALSLVGGTQPKNVKVGISNQISPITITHTGYYDYIFEPNYPAEAAFDFQRNIAEARRHDVPVAFHVNCNPWNDPADQSVDVLSNFLEITGSGQYLQRDRVGRFRLAATAQDPTIVENHDPFSPMLEMQLTLSRNATGMQDYLGRNIRQAMRVAAWYREMYPDIITLVTASSEYGMNDTNSDWMDYSSWSQQEFRDWLFGTGLYAGQGQYASFAAFKADANINTAVAGFATVNDVTPPTTVSWSNTTDTGRWWRLWHTFRVQQITNMEQNQFIWTRQAGWSPDRNFGHQIPFSTTVPTNPGAGTTSQLRLGSTYATTFGHSGSNGVTTYGSNASDSATFNAIYANDKNWGIYEYNPLDSVVANNLNALNAVWNSNGHAISPYAWGGQETYRIQGGSALLQALQQFIQAKNSSAWVGMNNYEAAPESRDVIWAMSETDDVESSNHLGTLAFSTGTLRTAVMGNDPYLSLELNEVAHPLIGDSYDAISLRMNAPGNGTAQIWWQDENNAFYSVNFPVTSGWRLYRINLASNPDWREKRIKLLRLDPISTNTGAQLELDWVRLHAVPCWLFDAAGEVNTISGQSGGVSGGVMSGTDSSGDGYFYLTTDKPAGQDADRAYIDADQFKVIRLRMTASTAASCQVYWWKRGDSTPNVASIAVNAGTQTYSLDMSGQANWSGDVTQLRLDPVNTNGTNYSIEYVNITRAMLPPRPANADTIHNTQYPVLDWQSPIEPNYGPLTTDVQISSDFQFTTLEENQSNLIGTRLIRQQLDVLDGLYWWRARTRESGGTVSPWSVPMPIFLRKWQANDARDVAVANDIGTSSTTGGVYTATTNGSDPYIYFNNGAFSGGQGINGDLYKKFRVRMKLAQPGGQVGAQFFFFPATGGFQTVNFPVVTDGQFHDYEIDLSTHPAWTGRISTVRIDPTSISGAAFGIDEAQLLPSVIAAPAPVSPIAWWDFIHPGDFEGWTMANQITGASVAGTSLSFNITGADPFIVSSGIMIDASVYKYIHIRMRNSTSSNNAQIYWITNTDGVYGTNGKVVSFPITPNDSGLRDYDINLGTVPGWQNSITQIRIDPNNGALSGSTQIDLIEITPALVPVELSAFCTE